MNSLLSMHEALPVIPTSTAAQISAMGSHHPLLWLPGISGHLASGTWAHDTHVLLIPLNCAAMVFQHDTSQLHAARRPGIMPRAPCTMHTIPPPCPAPLPCRWSPAWQCRSSSPAWS